ncbi:uncharacterized protein [Temnothorax longispinosus]|uniref:Uncharacterized protein n=1 Tax=Temnothorax longispinosus TaxID=300112 RepID=A0A4S2K9C9_9HYME|nr:Uncharacterized protein DBV15_11807 [Temnothorax longispinosus]
MATNDNGTNGVETEIAKGERDDVFEDYPRLERKRVQDKLRSKVSATRIAKRNVPRVSATSASTRIAELARPTKQRALNTLNEKAMTLPPAFVDNLVKIVEAESCLTPEEAARIRRQKERRTRKATRLPLRKKRTAEEIAEFAEDITRATTLDHDATISQYQMAERLVKSILEYRRETREGIPEIADVLMKRLISIDGYADAKNGDRATQQLQLLANVVARWITDVLAEVAETYKEAMKKYYKKRKMRRLDVNNNNKTNNKNKKTENWKQMGQMKEIEKQEGKNYETTKRNNPAKEKNEDEQKGNESGKEKDEAKEKAREREQLDDREAKSERVTEETVEREEKDEETKKREKGEEGKEVRENEEK